jgi:hypothetical protein
LQYVKPSEYRTAQTTFPTQSQGVIQQINSPTSPPVRQQYQQSEVIPPPQPVSSQKVHSLSPQERKQELGLPVDFSNANLNVQFGSLGINENDQLQAQTNAPPQQRTEEKDSSTHPSAPTLTQEQKQPEAPTEYGYGQTSGWGEDQYQNEQYGGEDEAAQYQQQYQQQQGLYGFQQQQPQQPRTEKGTTQPQRTSPNLQYGKQPYGPTHPYGVGLHAGAQNPYQYPPSYPSYPHPYMMPNQFQYQHYPHQIPSKYGQQFYGQNKPYGYPTGTGLPGSTTAPTAEESQLDYNKQFDMTLGQNPYFYMHQPQQQPQPGTTQPDTGKGAIKGKDSRSPSEQQQPQPGDQQQQQQMFGGHYPYTMHYGQYSYMFQPQGMGFPQQGHYPPQPTTQQGAQTPGTKNSRDQQQQSSLTSSTWQ